LTLLLDPELSRLAFEERLIEYCEDRAVPLLERVRLLGIAASRLDTFFMTRIGRLKRLVTVEGGARELELVAAECHRVLERAYRLLEDDLIPSLEAVDVRIVSWSDLSANDRSLVQAEFGARLGTMVRPLEVGPNTQFPHVRNLRPAIIAPTHDARGADAPLVVFELPAELPRFIPLPGGHCFVPLEDVVGATLPALWPERRFGGTYVFRVTRSAIMDLDDDADEDVLEVVEQEVIRRPFQECVRVEYERGMPRELCERLLRDLRRDAEMQGGSLDERDMYDVKRLIDLAALDEIADIDRPALKVPPIQRRAARFDGALLDVVRERELLVRFPYDTYESTIQRLLDEASRHPDVESMKLTLYRAGKDSKVVAALRTARARGVDVTAVVELKASFDERENIELARALEDDGVRVVLSPAKLKVHAKIGVVTLRGAGEPRRIAMIGTGNLNAATSRSYVDIWLLTGDRERAREIDAVFGLLTGREAGVEFRHLMVAPFNLRPRFLELIEREASHARAGLPSGIRAAMNGLTDRAIIAALSRASQAGVPIDLMVRGVCALQPGVEGVSDNIRVISVLGHLLQHARIFEFRNAGQEEYFIGSADWRPRNMDHRVEVITGVDRVHHDSLRAALDETLSDRGAWLLRSDGVYDRKEQKTLRTENASNKKRFEQKTPRTSDA
jgi:polyphosphate kinase